MIFQVVRETLVERNGGGEEQHGEGEEAEEAAAASGEQSRGEAERGTTTSAASSSAATMGGGRGQTTSSTSSSAESGEVIVILPTLILFTSFHSLFLGSFGGFFSAQEMITAKVNDLMEHRGGGRRRPFSEWGRRFGIFVGTCQPVMCALRTP